MHIDTRGILYVFKVVGDDVFKVGFTTKEDPSKGRMPNVQTGNHEDIEFVHMWPGSLAEEQALHKALTPFRTREKGEWYRLTVGALLEAISFTSQHLMAPDGEPELSLLDFDEYFEHSMVKVRVGPYKGMVGFFSYATPVPLASIPEAYHRVALEHYKLSPEGEVQGAEVFLEDLNETLWLPPVVLSHRG